MADPRVMERPRRWDLPFSRDLPNPAEARDMTQEDVARLLAIEPFRSMDPGKFPKSIPLQGILTNDSRIRKYRSGDVIVRQGDYGNSAFLILEGQVRVILKGLDPASIGRRKRRKRSWIRSLAQVVRNPRAPEVRDPRLYPEAQLSARTADRGREAVFVQDLANVLTIVPDAFERTENTIMKKDQIFGELAALGRIPRAATVVADGQAELLEVRWQGLRELRKYDEALRIHTDEQYRKYGLSATLQASPLLVNLHPDEIGQVAESAEFETYGRFDWYGTYQKLMKHEAADPLSSEPVIAQEGHYPNGLILIRAGFGRLSRRHGNGEMTFSYLGKGEVYGLAELVHNARSRDTASLTSTLRAVGYVDVVRIPTKVFEQTILPRLPAGPAPLRATKRSDPSGEHAGASSSPGPTGLASSGAERQATDPAMMEFLVENRFINGSAAMIIDLNRCTRCDDCVRACAAGHDNNPRFVRHGKVLGHHMVANACMHCLDPVCMIGCPTGAIHRLEERGEVVINDVTCIGCSTCASSCPYDNIRMVEIRDRSRDSALMIDPAEGKAILKATKCDLCSDHTGGPACQRACPHDALIRIDIRERDTLEKWLSR